MNIVNIEVDGIDYSDAPKFVDAYIAYAEHPDGSTLSDKELDAVNEDSDFVYQCVLNQIY